MGAVALHTRLTLYVDDATLETVGYVGTLVADHVKSVSAFAAGIIDAGMQFSDKKNVCTASHASIAREITKQVSMIKIKPARDVVSLGTAFAAGTRRTTKKTKARLRDGVRTALGVLRDITEEETKRMKRQESTQNHQERLSALHKAIAEWMKKQKEFNDGMTKEKNSSLVGLPRSSGCFRTALAQGGARLG